MDEKKSQTNLQQKSGTCHAPYVHVLEPNIQFLVLTNIAAKIGCHETRGSDIIYHKQYNNNKKNIWRHLKTMLLTRKRRSVVNI